ncbi:MAG TPA: protein kinase [Chloroflexota bacterium]|nr:protein kinase [Chloroflexota bacterium]
MENTLLNGRYQLEAEIGRGGMGVVYRAQDTLLDRHVAVKLLSAGSLGTEGRARLLHEAQAAARLNHPNIITIYDAGEVDGASYIIMELLDGESLFDHRPETLPEILPIAIQISTALEHAHANGVIHRDLKPENVIITQDGTAKLTDFGLARSMASRLTVEGAFIGTVFYLPPEQALGQPIDGRTDLYAFGVMLYELVTGQLPFTADDPLAVISQHLYAPPIPPSNHNCDLPPALDGLIMKLLQKNPDDRPTSATVVRQKLARIQQTLLSPPTTSAEEPLPSPLERLAQGRLVGREKELAAAKALWKQTTLNPGNRHVLVISGEPGVGKTPLMREIRTLAEISGATVLAGDCYANGHAPYTPIAQMLRTALTQPARRPATGQTKTAVPTLPDPILADLITLAPDLRPLYPDLPPNPSYDAQADQHRLFESAITFWASLAERAPLLLIVEDVHWADSGTLELMRHLARRCRLDKLPILIVMTYRDVELDAACCLDDIVYDLTREQLVLRLKLNRFDREQTRTLLTVMFQETISDDFLEAIYRETDGNQFFIEELCKALITEGKLYRQDGRWQRPNMAEVQLPQSVRGAILARVNSLPDATQEVLRWAAIIGRDFDFGVLQQASELEEEALIDALETAVHAQLISERKPDRYTHVRAGDETFTFAHALTVTTLRESMSVIRRRRLHSRAAAALARRYPDDYEALAYHYAEAGDIERARHYYTKAGDRALTVHTNQEAERHFRAALELNENNDEKGELLSRLGEALYGQNRYDEAVDVWLQAIPLCRAQAHHDHVARLYARAARAAWHVGDTPRGLALCREGMAGLPPESETSGTAVLLHETGRACFFNGLPDEALALCQQAMTLAEKLDLVEVQADTLATIGVLPGQTTEARIAALQKAIALAEPADLLAAAMRAHTNLGGQLKHTGDLEQARYHSRRAVELGQRAGMVMWKMDERVLALSDALTKGDVVAAQELLAELRDLVPTMPASHYKLPLVDLMAAWLSYQCGDHQTAVDLLLKCQSDFRQRGDLQQLAGLNNDLGFVLREINRLDEAEATLLEAVEIGDRGLGTGPVSPRTELAVVYAYQGRHEEAAALLRQAEELVGDGVSFHEQGQLNQAKALIAVRQRRWQEAFGHFAQAVQSAEAIGARWFQADITRQWAEAHLARGEADDRQRARELLQQCESAFAAMQNEYALARVRALLAGI